MEKNNTNIENNQEKEQQSGYCLSVSGGLDISANGTSSSYEMSIWGVPVEVAHEIYDDRIEFIYKKTKMIWVGYYSPEVAVYKIVYSCKDGLWHKSEPIYGKIIEPQVEQYEFDE